MKQARTILDYLDRRLGGHAGGGPEYVFHCPACVDRLGSEGSKRKFAINLTKRRGQCFRCEFKFRDIHALFRQLNGGSLTMEERILLRDDPPIVVESVRRTVMRTFYKEHENSRAPRKLRRHRLPPGFTRLDDVDTTKMPWKRAVTYLNGRGITREDITNFGIGYVSRGRYARYLVFPLTIDGELVYWTSRYTGNHPRGIKSQNPKKDDGYYGREHVLLNFDRVMGQSFAMLVEGPLDTVAAINGLGALGSKISPFQIALIDRLVENGLRELCIALDPGEGTEIDRTRAILVEHVPTVSTLLFTHGDPCSRRAELPELVAGRVSGALTLAQRVRSRLATK